MIININQIISNILDENYKLLSSTKSETYIIYPEQGKLLKSKITGITTDKFIAIGSKDDINNYEEIDK